MLKIIWSDLCYLFPFKIDSYASCEIALYQNSTYSNIRMKMYFFFVL